MFGMGMGEIILIAVVALLVLGPDRLPSAAKAIGKGIRDLRSQTRDLQQTIEKDTQLGDAVRELRGALRGDPETLYERATGQRLSDIGKTPKGPSTPVLADGSPADGSSSPEATTDASSSAASDTGDHATNHTDPVASAIVDASVDRSFTPPPSDAGPLDPDQPVIRTAPGAVARSSSNNDDDDANHG